jgi:hypothetical protein
MTTSAGGPLDSIARGASAALDRSLGVLACPHCGAALARVDRSLRCSNGHDFDIARQGYVGFTSGGGPHHQGDTAEMVSARDAFLAAGYYAPIVTAISEHAPLTGWCVELAGGTGYYIGGVLDESPGLGGVTVDVSKNAARLAAHAHDRLAHRGCARNAALRIRKRRSRSQHFRATTRRRGRAHPRSGRIRGRGHSGRFTPSRAAGTVRASRHRPAEGCPSRDGHGPPRVQGLPPARVRGRTAAAGCRQRDHDGPQRLPPRARRNRVARRVAATDVSHNCRRLGEPVRTMNRAKAPGSFTSRTPGVRILAPVLVSVTSV